MRIVIDMQGAQSASRMRGIGRYTLSFVEALVRNRGEHEIVLALNGLFSDTVEPIRLMFRDLLPRENIRVWFAPGPVSFHTKDNDERRQRAELIREAFLASLNPDIIHITSLFEGFDDDAATSVGSMFGRTPLSVTLYDLIPLLDDNQFLGRDKCLAEWYRRKLDYLTSSDMLLAISESSRDDAITNIGISPTRIYNVGSACSNIFQKRQVSTSDVEHLYSKFNLRSEFIVCSSTLEPHKNLQRFLRCFSSLPNKILEKYKVVLVGRISDFQRELLNDFLSSINLSRNQVISTGYVTDYELVSLYNLCDLTVVPSYLEGFGLPALEAMACGAAVIGSSAPSISEVIGLKEALFDPYDDVDLTAKLRQALSDKDFRTSLRSHGLERAQRFSWNETARSALSFLEQAVKKFGASETIVENQGLPKLAYVSPLPPSQTGIAEYSAELIAPLSEHYEITCIIDQPILDNQIVKFPEIRSSEWFRINYKYFDRVLYQVGNSPFHEYMRALMEDIPGVMVLHDFFLSSYLFHIQSEKGANVWTNALYDSHGYTSVKDSLLDDMQTVADYPANLTFIRNSQGVIVHSAHSRHLAEQWYGEGFSDNWHVVPMLRQPSPASDREKARALLGISKDSLVVCSFGLLAPTKLNHRLLDAFLSSTLAGDSASQLVFVGQHGGEYGASLDRTIRKSGISERIRITGWADMATYRNYLAAADIAVQLRTQSRGETSAATLDCLNYGLATVVNAHGSLAELPDESVWKLPDNFHDSSLIEALETLRKDAEARRSLGERGRDMIGVRHAPAKCARSYRDAIENFHSKSAFVLPKLIEEIASKPPPRDDDEYVQLSAAISLTLPRKRPRKCIYLDISETCRTELRSGIERAAVSITLALLAAPPKGWRVEPVYLDTVSDKWVYRQASVFTLRTMGFPQTPLRDDVIEPQAGDILLGLDFSGQALINAEAFGLHADYRKLGVSVYFVVFDILPLTMPEFFPPEADKSFKEWLLATLRQHGVLCISKAVADDLSAWIRQEKASLAPFARIDWFHLGADIDEAAPSKGLPDASHGVLGELHSRPTFLMVGTVEPRKGHLQVLDAFTRLWAHGLDANLVVVGAEGWKPVTHSHRRSIPGIVERLRASPEGGKRLFWLESISDEYLEKIYEASDCLIAASEGEGFGLPLIESARHKLPILVRDIPVFREVSGNHAYYFSGSDPEDLAAAIDEWLTLYRRGEHPTSDKMPWLTWRESALMLVERVMEGHKVEVPAEEQGSAAA
ncbi:glycosyltransferase [Mesorhizobium abyssinicae]|uniref:glycosyltransferase n=1 Tax=Mesorhizobium TaxID=68287 RepID=UPI000FD37089|nr:MULTISPECIES: glycosyltransferase [Mesorhizobium]RVC64539.1 glycosyltransferase [Mesorhizobium sp. M4B.F.Ca.ET.088.02.2.1]MDX8436151.1 glycosyltransferase [Mesorhizobium abyssinicae]RWF26881.1 MAG: glycosyltransferase [Mesorhizobium sp.]RWF41040.1 MAG: glycosyltransferase [Mesorhizobium sp.]TIX17951.1 MAG: glycosyltransferase [Mesorhizobium sp.]